MIRAGWYGVAGCLVLSLGAGAALAFGTVRMLGQDAEHERITRRALSCAASSAYPCFEAKSLDELAGKKGTFGAVGAPDHPARGLMASDEAHCDNGDWMDVAGYPQSRETARATLGRCRDWIDTHLDAATDAAGALLKDGRIDAAQLPAVVPCGYNGKAARAKCNVLEHFGLVLHASQDFYSHSNWVDTGGSTLANPPGLGRSGRSPWLDVRADPPFPDGLMTGCYRSSSVADVDGVGGCAGRVTHVTLNKDKGVIDPQIGAGKTSRGKIGGNFRRAVEAATDDTGDKWKLLQERIIARYGARDGNLIICAIARDTPQKTCKA